MNKNKIDSSLIDNVNIQNTKNSNFVFVFTENFNKTKQFLDNYKYSYTPYRFANCFYLNADHDDLSILSYQNDITFIKSNTVVQTQNFEQDFINLEKIREGKFYGQGQTICFIDTGIFPHFDFIFPQSKIIKFVDLINKKSTPYDDNGHGTFVAGICSGNGVFSKNNMGIAPMSNIISIKALGKSGDSNSNVILDAMQWVYDNHKVYNISVVCMSFGADVIDKFDPLSNGAEALWKAGITVVVAAGNSGPKEKTIKSPGNNPYVITVGALDVSNLKVANFSSRGPTIYGNKPDLLCPAVDLISCSNLALPYTTMSGTSVATPIVAGVCAVLKSKNPQMSNNEIKEFLLSHCSKITGDINSEGHGYLKF